MKLEKTMKLYVLDEVMTYTGGVFQNRTAIYKKRE